MTITTECTGCKKVMRATLTKDQVIETSGRARQVATIVCPTCSTQIDVFITLLPKEIKSV